MLVKWNSEYLGDYSLVQYLYYRAKGNASMQRACFPISVWGSRVVLELLNSLLLSQKALETEV